MEEKKCNSLKIKYILKCPQNWEMEEFIITENFVPTIYNKHKHTNQIADYDLGELFDHEHVASFELSNIIRGKEDILLDMMYCLFFIRPSFRYHGIYEPLPYMDLQVIGIYTELIKQDIKLFKRGLSEYINCFFSEDSRQTYQQINFINRINNIDFRVSNHNEIKPALQLYLKNSNFNNSFEYEIDLTKIDRLISLLKKYEVLNPKNEYKNYITSDGCFCLAQSQNQFYFSISGTASAYDSFGKELESYLKQYFKHNSITYCSLNDETLSFFKKDKKKLLPLNQPLRYGDAKDNYDEKRISELYSCCERKIFSNLINTNDLLLICKYNPCKKCIPAVKIENKTRNNFIFYSFAENPESFKNYLNKSKTKLIHKLEMNIVNII